MLVAFYVPKNPTVNILRKAWDFGRMTNLLKLTLPVVVVVALLGAGGLELARDDWDRVGDGS